VSDELDDLDDELCLCEVCGRLVEMWDRDQTCYDCNRGDI